VEFLRCFGTGWKDDIMSWYSAALGAQSRRWHN
jgi:hypothetical protein